MRTKNEEYFKMIEEFIDEYKEKTGTAPTVQEISNGIGVPKTTVGRYLAYMREHGMLDYTGHRNIQTKASQMTRGETIMTPILGKVSCGVPKFAEENIEEYVRLPVALFGRGQFFILRANGDSMVEADINDGDLVLIRQQNYADEGQIVVALMDDEATLKRYYPEPDMPRKPKHPCAYPGCPELTDRRYCEKHQKLNNKQYERYGRDPNTKKRYGRAWKRIRDSYASEHPFCERCYKEGKLIPVEQVHHIKPLAEGGTHERSNLISLCASCHARIHAERGDRWHM